MEKQPCGKHRSARSEFPGHAFAAVLLLAACSPKSPTLQPPDRVESFCPDKGPSGGELADVLSSVADRIDPAPYPDESSLRANIREFGGAVAHWDAQPLYMPATAAALGVPGDYIDVTDVAIDNQFAPPDARLIYVTVGVPGGVKKVVLRAYDTRNICEPGTRLS